MLIHKGCSSAKLSSNWVGGDKMPIKISSMWQKPINTLCCAVLRISLISPRCWWVKGLYHERLLLRHVKCEVDDRLTPAPVLPVVAFIWTLLLSLLSFAKGKKASWIAVAKQPGLAIALAFSIRVLFISGRPYTNGLPPYWASFCKRKSVLKSTIIVEDERIFC